jgi:hypothetical protein
METSVKPRSVATIALAIASVASFPALSEELQVKELNRGPGGRSPAGILIIQFGNSAPLGGSPPRFSR